MSRLVLPANGATRAARGYQGDEYQDRVAKYIPAEVVGGYVSLDGILSKPVTATTGSLFQLTDTAYAQGAQTAQAPSLGNALLASLASVPGIIFLICLVLAPLYVFTLARRAGTSVWKAQALISAFAFVVWAYAIKGTIFFQNSALDKWAQTAINQAQFYNPQWGAALLVLFSMAVAFYQPKG